jgi:hypothetical protein
VRAERGQRHAPARALEQRRADDRLERPDQLAHARLRNAQALRRAAEVQLIGHREERTQVAQLDRLPHFPTAQVSGGNETERLVFAEP